MKSAPLPPNEARRLKTLESYNVMDTPKEQDFDDLTQLAAHICGAPIALISLVDEKRQWFKSAHGLAAAETPREFAFCSHTILTDEMFIVPDSSKDERFHDNPLVKGDPFVQFYAGAPLIAHDGMRLGSLCVIDHSTRNLTDDQITALQRLARQVITQLELRRVNAMLNSAHKVKSQFLANMSHEIRTPMNGIIGVAEILNESPLSDDQRNNIRIISSCGRTLLNLINDILDFSKLESNKMEFENTAFDPSETFRDVIAIFSNNASKKGVTLSIESEARLPKLVLGDANRLSQVLSNLVSNAVKFTERGSVRVKVSSRKEGDKHYFKVMVVDSGIGIPADVVPKLFNSFVQADASTTRRFGGSGLGLAISRALCEGMNGSLTCRSIVGEGSIFEFTFEAEEVSVAAEPKRKLSDLIASNPAGLRILLAEDNEVNQVVGLAMLKKLGYNATVAANGEAVLKLLENEDYDLILMDRHMPLLDGVQTTQEILKRWPEKRPRIVALTASALKEDEEACLAAGMDDFITKPVSLSDLSRVLTAEVPMSSANQ